MSNQRPDEEVELSDFRLAAIVESSDDAIISKDLNGIITSWNGSAERLFGYTAEEAIGRSITLLMPPDRLEEEPKILEQLRRGERVDHFETIRVRKDGSRLDISLTISPIRNAEGKIVGASKIARDITERKRIDKTLRDYAAQLRQVDRRKDEFLATLAHELRNSLAPIRNAVEILRQPDLSAEHSRVTLDIAEHQVNGMVRLIDDLLDVSRISQGKIDLKKQRVALQTVVDRALDTTRPNVEENGHSLTVSLPDESVYLDADPLRLVQALSNLINNACKYSEPKGTIEIRAQVDETAALVLSIKDNGIGIAPEDLSQIFGIFSQVHSAAAHAKGGLGIGLSLVKAIIELHGGSVEAKSGGLGKGSEFVVRLPGVQLEIDDEPLKTASDHFARER
jgi:two-component system, chemotaxis family, CheB/CheR fusion protein